ncbi:Immunoglobulin superfamily member 6 [Oryzias melastigma]|nr:Immunoglobulin superfamily member 6 [Oryzias melastigma]
MSRLVTDMKLLIWLALLLIVFSRAENNENCRLQQTQKIWRKTGGSVNLSCIISVCSSDKIEYKWFVFKEDRHFALNSSGTYSLNAENLTIKSLNIADSGIYYCGTGKTKCCNPLVGLGTTLVVTGKTRNLLLLALILLVIFNLAIVTFIILKKYCWKKTSSLKTSVDVKDSVRKKSHFRNVLQELHNRENLRKSKNTATQNPLETKRDPGHVSTDSIYQNV